MLQIAKEYKFSGNDVWKPVQTGIQFSTRTVIDMHRFLWYRKTANFCKPAAWIRMRLKTSSVKCEAKEILIPVLSASGTVCTQCVCRSSCRCLKPPTITLIKCQLCCTCWRETIQWLRHTRWTVIMSMTSWWMMMHSQANSAVSEIDYIDRNFVS